MPQNMCSPCKSLFKLPKETCQVLKGKPKRSKLFSPSGQRNPRPKAKYVNYDKDCTDQQLPTHFRKQAGTAPLRKSHTPARRQACVTVAQGGAQEQLDHAQKDAKCHQPGSNASLTWQQKAPHRKSKFDPEVEANSAQQTRRVVVLSNLGSPAPVHAELPAACTQCYLCGENTQMSSPRRILSVVRS